MIISQPSGQAPTYHELDGSLVQQTTSAGAWVDFTLTGVSPNSCVDILIQNNNGAGSALVGVRIKGSALSRTITFPAVNQAVLTIRVLCDGNFKIQIWDTATNNNVFYRCIGYWA